MGLKWLTDLGNVLPFAGMVLAILFQVSSMVVSKAALSQGMDKYALAVYSSALSTLILFPCFIIIHSSASSRPPITFDVFCGLIFLAVLGSLEQIIEYFGIQYSSPTLGTAMLNLIPAFTFILTLIFRFSSPLFLLVIGMRLENLDWRSSSSTAKFAGTIVSIAGAFVVTSYKGPAMMKTMALSLNQQSDWILGGFFLATEALMFAAGYIVQGFLSTVISLLAVNDPSAWRVKYDMGLVAIVYGAVARMLRFGLGLWCVWKTGPLYVSMFKPLAIVISAVMSIAFLGDVLCLGSLIGAIIIVVGFYAFMWGKANEKDSAEIENGVESSISSNNKDPLLENKIRDV